MINEVQLIQNPFGINVFGSAITRVTPDIVSLNFAVARLRPHPKDAFQEVRKASQAVRTYLEQAKVDEMGVSRIGIAPAFEYTHGEKKFLGYTARVSFQVLLRQLERMEDILSGIVDAGVNEVSSVDFRTTRLKELRADARKRAVEAAREKADNYCKAAGVKLGRPIHIEDVDPDVLHGRESQIVREIEPDDSGEIQAFDPGSITVGGAVLVAYTIEY